MRLRHIGIVTQQAEAMKAFYEKKGFTTFYDQEEKVRIIKMRDDKGGIIELLQYESQGESTLRQLGISHIAFTEDPDGNNLEMVKLKTLHTITVVDPTGNLVEFVMPNDVRNM